MLITVNILFTPISRALGPKRLAVFGRLWWWGTAVGHSSRTPPLPPTNHMVPEQIQPLQPYPDIPLKQAYRTPSGLSETRPSSRAAGGLMWRFPVKCITPQVQLLKKSIILAKGQTSKREQDGWIKTRRSLENINLTMRGTWEKCCPNKAESILYSGLRKPIHV